jgi:TorA maturation chaperone TorD
MIEMNPHTTLDNVELAHDQALCRSFIYNWLAVALQFPTPDTASELLSEKSKTALPSLAGWIAGDTAPGLMKAVNGLVESFESQSLETLRTAYVRLFGHTARGLVCPYETEFGQSGEFQQPRQLGKVNGFYNAFGLTVSRTGRERADHVSCELEFMAFLSRKEAFALEQGANEMLQETQKAARLFLRDHLGRFGRAFAYLLCKEDCQGFWGRLGGVLFEFITIECRRLNIAAGPPLIPLRPVEEAEVPMACGESSP